MKLRYIILSIIIVTTTCISCRQAKDETSKEVYINMEDVNSVNYKDVFEKQEIIELSHVDGAYMAGYNRMFVSDSIYLFANKNSTLYLFDSKGEFISNSSEKRGKGHKEYEILLAATYNKHSGNIEVVTPIGIMMYDRQFNYVGKSLFSDKETKSLMFNYIYDINSHEHILLSPLNVKDKTSYIYIYDSKERRVIHKMKYEKECPFITMQEQCISDGNFIAFPCMNYSFFNIDFENYELNKCVRFDFGSDNLTDNDYSHFSKDHQLKKYLAMECEKSLPLRTFRSGNRIVSLVKSGKRRADIKTYIIDIDNAKGQYIDYQYEKIKMPLFEAFNNGILYACVSEDELVEHVDLDLLDGKSKEIMDRHTEESNYYILKYYLKGN